MKVIAKKIPTKKANQLIETPSFQTIVDKFLAGEIKGFQTNLQKFRLFKAQGDVICYYKEGSSRRGYALYESHLTGFQKYLFPESVNSDEITYKNIAKFRKYASKASFTNEFIKDCLALPDTYQKWEAEGKKSLYEYGITTGVSREGEVITVDSLKDILHLDALKYAIANKIDFVSYRNKFRGYEATITIKVEDGILHGWLAMEYVNCGNGHYYSLINDNCFIYIDKD